MDADANYPIRQAIADTSLALAGELGIDSGTVKRVLSPWVLRRVPREERQDVLQDLVCRALQVRPQTPGLLYCVFRFFIADWWKARRYRQHDSLDAMMITTDADAGGPFEGTLPG